MKTTKFIDLHTDIINIFSCLNMEKSQKADFWFFVNDWQINIDFLKKSNTSLIFSSSFSFFESQFSIGNNLLENILYTIYLNKRIINDNSNIFELVLKSSDIERINNKSKIWYLLHIEWLYSVKNKYMIDLFYELWVRSIWLLWNEDSNIWTSCRQWNYYWLSKFWKEIVEYIEKKWMILDLAHIWDTSFEDVMKIVKKPVIVSHTAVRSLNNYDRNITDKQMKMVKKSWWLVWITWCSFFLNWSIEASLEEYIKHIKYAIDLIWIDYVWIGSDFEWMWIDVCPKWFHSINDLWNLKKWLKNIWLSDEDIDKIFYKNAEKFIKKII